jgi:hypothetical protein
LGITAIALSDGDDFIHVRPRGHGVNPLNPTANVPRISLQLSFLDQGLFFGMGDEDVVEVYGYLSGGE